MITGLDHAAILTDKLEETTRFFTDIIGLKRGPRPTVRIPGEWLYAGDCPIVHLAAVKHARANRGTLDHISLAVSDLDETVNRINAAGVQCVAVDIPGGFGRQAFVKDPNGVTIELTARTLPP